MDVIIDIESIYKASMSLFETQICLLGTRNGVKIAKLYDQRWNKQHDGFPVNFEILKGVM